MTDIIVKDIKNGSEYYYGWGAEVSAEDVSYDNTTSGMTATDVQEAIDEVFQSVSNGKTLIAAAITDKGVQTAASDSFSTMATNIRAIDTSSFIMWWLNLYNNRVSGKDWRPVTRDHISWIEWWEYYGCCLYELEWSSANSFEVWVYTYRKITDYNDIFYTLNNVTGSVSGSFYTTMAERAFYTNGTYIKIVFIFDTTASSNSYRCYEAVWDYKHTWTTSNTLIWSWDSRHIADYNVDLTWYTQITNQDWVSAVTWEKINDNAYMYLTLTPQQPEPHWNDYIELSTVSTCTLNVWTPCYYAIDDASTYSTTQSSISVPAGNHTVKFFPMVVSNGWASSFKLPNWVSVLIHDAPYYAYNTSNDGKIVGSNYKKEFAKGCTTLTSVPAETCTIPSTVTTINDWFMYAMFRWCSWLTTFPTIVIPDSVTTIGNDFMREQFFNCTWLTTTTAESMSNNVTSIGDYFMADRFNWCTWLTAAQEENMGSSLLTIGSYYRQLEYASCSSMTTTPAEDMSDTLTSIGNYFAYRKFYHCTWLTTTQQEYVWTSLTTIWTYFRNSEYEWCTWLLSTRDEVLPNTVTNIWGNFRRTQFTWCSNITTVWEESRPSSLTTVSSNCRYQQFIACNAITSITWWRDSNIGSSNYRYQQFGNCNTNKTIKVLTDVWYAAQSNTLSNTYVTEVQVPTAYLSNFIGSSSYPRSGIDDSKFVWY